MRVWVPLDAAAKALGADDVAAALARELPETTITRNGTRGMIWLEPLVEIERDGVRLGFGPVDPDDVPGLVEAIRIGAAHPLALGPVEELPWMKAQSRLTFARVGVIDPLSLTEYEANGGLAGLRRAIVIGPSAVVEDLIQSGLRGRGGAGFPTGIKWKTVAGAKASQKYIVCNADEGDSGSFADRMLMEGDPLTLIEGMAIAGIAVGATQGYVYCRSEYPDAIRVTEAAIALARRGGVLGESVLGSEYAFDMEVRVGAGAYVCGEETSLLNSLEGKRGTVRAKPPIPALEGFLGRPTVVNNLVSLATVPWILANGGEEYAKLGIGRSKGTIPIQISGNVRHGGLFEAAFGMTLAEIIEEVGGGTASGRPVKAAQVGGPLGAYIPAKDFDVPFGYEELAGRDGLLGHAGITVFDDTADMLKLARFAMEFCAVESCGKCTPCRIGSVRGVETIDRIAAGDSDGVEILKDLCNTMKWGSLCALGGFAPFPVMSALTHFPDEFSGRNEPRKEAAE
ncbi:NADH-ubiquinone oxidoreductase-F iron-sulfur binding region domain-containing protein [Paracoccus sp. CPCC 101403]|uniref:NADH-ubiquinone oxidoreductase-F iron-sulfur binding region domain-containing protein n=1 Tax=Paracoccus broussonetiae TaxID=3075834 RepID=A0ABU3EBD0_9RHOB|nr:NADH-ubiquinone oxidoreductase-F iron-sulfur binding region domain-containing protein [Paracoccus sp. CPCC 101403]MDT1061514.1 NADH-ubiquinone oxidoreductase-F iron-sulfur binding region domain-containing protein [Paracoccus sp. CPCC 101403]